MMFDANAASVKEGELFFAEVHGTDSQLLSAGINCGDIILCSHVKKSDERPRINLISKIWSKKYADPLEWSADGSEEWSWMVYSGRPDGSGFISPKWRAKALEFLGGEWGKKQGSNKP